METRTIDLRSSGSVDHDANRQVGDELAECLERFLAASADERTLDRARTAVALWYGLTEEYSVTSAI